MKIYIYGLFDPITNELRYIGKTINLETRLKAHVSEALKSNVNVSKIEWIKSLVEKGLEPVISILEEVDESKWEEAEKRWIASCRDEGIEILNIADGGSHPPDWMGKKQSVEHIRRRVKSRQIKGNYILSQEGRRKISEKNKGRFVGVDNGFFGRQHSKESKKKMSESSKGQVAWNKGIPCLEETKDKIRSKAKGKVHSDETKEKISQANKGRKLSPEQIEKNRQRMLGSHLSEETKQKLREANLGKTHTEETKQKLSEIGKGKIKSELHRKRLGESIKKKFAEDLEYKEEFKAMRKETQKLKWQDPEYRAKMIEAQKRRREREKLKKNKKEAVNIHSLFFVGLNIKSIFSLPPLISQKFYKPTCHQSSF